MKNNKIKTICTVAIVFTMAMAFQTSSVYAQKDYGKIINLAGRQRMLTQKMSKEMLLISLGADVKGNKDALRKSAKLFNKVLEGLINGDKELGLPAPTDKAILAQLRKVKSIWSEFKTAVDEAADPAKKGISEKAINKMYKRNIPLLKNMHQVVQMYAEEAKRETGKAAGTVINLAGKQRMLTQKMSKELLLVARGVEVEKNRKGLSKTSALFDRTLKGLINGDETLGLPPTTNKNILAQLGKVQSLWGDFKMVVDEAADPAKKVVSGDCIKKMTQLNIPLLKAMHQAVLMYQEESK